MTLISPTLATIPVLVAAVVATGRIVALLAREARLMAVVWLALRGTRPDQRAEIIRAFTGRQGMVNGNAADSDRHIEAPELAHRRNIRWSRSTQNLAGK